VRNSATFSGVFLSQILDPTGNAISSDLLQVQTGLGHIRPTRFQI
jgi:hypothetical protein